MNSFLKRLLLKYKKPAMAVALAGLLFLTYSNSLHSGFMIDDHHVLLMSGRNHNIQNILNFFSDPASSHYFHYRPLTAVVRFFLYQSFRENPIYYHMFNLCLFYSYAMLMFFFWKKLVRNETAVFLATALFCVHPINSMVVNYMTAHEVALYGIFMMLSVICFLFYVEKKYTTANYAASLICFVLALLFQEITATLPLFLVALIYFKEKYSLRKSIVCCLPWIMIAVFYSLGRSNIYVDLTNGHIIPANLTLLSYIAGLVKLISQYLQNLVFPQNVIFIWNTQPIEGFVMYRNAVIFLTAIAICTVGFFVWRKNDKFFALTWGLIGFIPVCAATLVMPALGMIIEPHWFFFSSTGFFILAGMGSVYLKQHLRLGIWIAFMCVVIAALSVQTRGYNVLWGNEKEYCQHWLKKSAGNPVPMMILGRICISEKNYDLAIGYFEQLLKVKNYDRSKVYYNLGIVYLELDDLLKSEENIRQAIALNPHYALGYHALGTVFVKRKEYLPAERFFKEALRIEPYSMITLLNLGDLYLMQNKTQDALKQYEKVIKIDPYHPEYRETLAKLAVLYFQNRQLDQSYEIIEHSLKRDSGPENYMIFALAFSRMGAGDVALDLLNVALKQHPENIGFYRLCGEILFEGGQFEKAREYVARGLAVDSRDEGLLRLKEQVLQVFSTERSGM